MSASSSRTSSRRTRTARPVSTGALCSERLAPGGVPVVLHELPGVLSVPHTLQLSFEAGHPIANLTYGGRREWWGEAGDPEALPETPLLLELWTNDPGSETRGKDKRVSIEACLVRLAGYDGRVRVIKPVSPVGHQLQQIRTLVRAHTAQHGDVYYPVLGRIIPAAPTALRWKVSSVRITPVHHPKAAQAEALARGLAQALQDLEWTATTVKQRAPLGELGDSLARACAPLGGDALALLGLRLNFRAALRRDSVSNEVTAPIEGRITVEGDASEPTLVKLHLESRRVGHQMQAGLEGTSWTDRSGQRWGAVAQADKAYNDEETALVYVALQAPGRLLEQRVKVPGDYHEDLEHAARLSALSAAEHREALETYQAWQRLGL